LVFKFIGFWFGSFVATLGGVSARVDERGYNLGQEPACRLRRVKAGLIAEARIELIPYPNKCILMASRRCRSMLRFRFGPTVSVHRLFVRRYRYFAHQIDRGPTKPKFAAYKRFSRKTCAGRDGRYFLGRDGGLMVPLAEIENAALFRPHRPTMQYTQPLYIKGVVRYVTPREALIDKWSNWIFSGGWFFGILAMIIYRVVERRSKGESWRPPAGLEPAIARLEI